ncbi:MAG: exodeoxyribonuclease VII large subunit [Paenisporosarcina sp.]
MSSASYLTVKALTKYIKRKFDADPHLRNVFVKGELSNVKIHSSGHVYFTLKDDQSRMPAVLFAAQARLLKFKPESGMNVLVQGDVNVYENSGQYQLYAQHMQPDGIGELFIAYEQLKEKLQNEGLFSDSRKRPIPKFPQKIGVITATTGAAIRDITTTLNRRYPLAEVLIFPALVQGVGAAPSIVKAIQQAQNNHGIDVLIVGRGGGSIEDLWAFNEEIVARAIVDSLIPIISAVGHETDTTIADYVADLRAPTPTAAAELAVPSQIELLKHMMNRTSQLVHLMTTMLAHDKKRLNRVISSYPLSYPERLYRPFIEKLTRLQEQFERSGKNIVVKHREQYYQNVLRLQLQNPQKSLDPLRKNVQNLHERMQIATKSTLQNKGKSFGSSLRTLEALNPLTIMNRGYSISYQNDRVIKSVDEINKDEPLRISLQDGEINATIQSILKKAEGESL